MSSIEENGAAAKVVLIAVAINSLFLIGNGFYMLVAPLAWYQVVPGVSHTGPFNQHFVRDIGLIQMFLGVLFAIGIRLPASRRALWAAATAWLVAHAILHFWEVAVGICSPSALARDFPAVTLPAIIGVVATAWVWRRPAPLL